jgi:hypothetical protein
MHTMTRTMTRATRNCEHDRTECVAQRRGVMRQVDDGTATPRVVGPARGRGQRLGAGVNAVDLDGLSEWDRADRVGLNHESSAIAAVGPSNGRVATTH